MITSGRALTKDITIDAPACVVGTGAGGGMMLKELAAAGIPAIALEEGSDHPPHTFNQREEQMLPELFQERAGRMTDDLAINVLGGRGVGGSTIHNTNLCKRTPREILDLWTHRYGVTGCSPAEMEPTFAAVEQELSVSLIPDARVNANNDVLRRGVMALGWRGGVLAHNRIGCIGSGFCEVGCAYDAKQNARKVLIPRAIERGARVFSDVRATRVLHDGKSVLGVEAVTANGHKVRVRTKLVVLAGSAVGSAALAIASDLPDPHEQQGMALRIHPGGVVAGVFDQPLDGWKGIPQSYECTEWLDLNEGSQRRVWITTAFAHPVGTAVTLPGFGAAHMRSMRSYRNFAVLTAMVHDETSGRVYVDNGRAKLRYKMIDGDRQQLAIGLRACARLLLAAGAREAIVPSIFPIHVKTERDLDKIDASLRAPLTAVHPMGTMRMGGDPKTSVVQSTGEHHHVKGLFVADGSLFPTSLGGPPQISIYSFAKHLARYVIEAARGH